ncbi:acyl-CoA thioesterase II [uncultured Pseudoteredinibacter sp.]|uniref:acyl-CoA thioesterase n=1 Tax=uncultured Pseudoteredinibacter sp. TaxID=1641701 RepID=UPI0026140872|nr:acyl-CoA thioesterase II [uncultured Pseudoteredinibacter sp.]
MYKLNQLLDTLEVEQLDKYLFRGTSLPLALPRVYGGQVLAQAINAAARTIESDRQPHSMHAYFLRPGDAKRPIIFDVDPIRDGGSFNTRRVVAKQNGAAIFNCSISFQKVEKGLEHQMDLPAGTPMPDELESDQLRTERIYAGHADKSAPFIFPLSMVDIRSTQPQHPIDPEPAEPEHGFWFRFNGKLADNDNIHRTLLTYISDYKLMTTGLRPHRVPGLMEKIQGASLDHSMWFHNAVRVDEWIYYHLDSPKSGGSRAFNRGSFYSHDGLLLASTAQEGLIRVRD